VFGNVNLKLDRRSGSCTFLIGCNPKGLTVGHICLIFDESIKIFLFSLSLVLFLVFSSIVLTLVGWFG
jgi:hypothetical protein